MKVTTHSEQAEFLSRVRDALSRALDASRDFRMTRHQVRRGPYAKDPFVTFCRKVLSGHSPGGWPAAVRGPLRAPDALRTGTPGSAAVVEGHLVAVGVGERESAAERPVDGR